LIKTGQNGQTGQTLLEICHTIVEILLKMIKTWSEGGRKSLTLVNLNQN
jgi:hypothetical protein